MRVEETANDGEVHARVGQELEVVLNENRTTGYRWEVVDPGAPVCRLVRDAAEAGGAAPGAAGRHRWWFRAEAVGTATVSLAYRRPFGPPGDARRFTLRVVVE